MKKHIEISIGRQLLEQKISHVRILAATVIMMNKLRQGRPKQSQNSLVNLGGIYLCPYGPELRTDQIDQSEES